MIDELNVQLPKLSQFTAGGCQIEKCYQNSVMINVECSVVSQNLWCLCQQLKIKRDRLLTSFEILLIVFSNGYEAALANSDNVLRILCYFAS